MRMTLRRRSSCISDMRVPGIPPHSVRETAGTAAFAAGPTTIPRRSIASETNRLPATLRAEESHHLARGIRSIRFGEGAVGATARPGVTAAVQDPVLDDRRCVRVDIDLARVATTAL